MSSTPSNPWRSIKCPIHESSWTLRSLHIYVRVFFLVFGAGESSYTSCTSRVCMSIWIVQHPSASSVFLHDCMAFLTASCQSEWSQLRFKLPTSPPKDPTSRKVATWQWHFPPRMIKGGILKWTLVFYNFSFTIWVWIKKNISQGKNERNFGP